MSVKRLLATWLPLAIVASVLSVTLYVVVQQSFRMGANDLPNQIAADAVGATMDEGRFMFVVTIPPRFGTDLRSGRHPDIQLSIDATAMQQAAIGAGLKSICVGDPSYYAIVENPTMFVMRNPYLYMANGQVGFFATMRIGGAVLLADAFQYATHPTG